MIVRMLILLHVNNRLEQPKLALRSTYIDFNKMLYISFNRFKEPFSLTAKENI